MQVNLKRTMEPKVYGLLIEFEGTIFLSIQYAYSLEDAYIMAKLEFNKQNPDKLLTGNSLLGAKIGLFAIKELKVLTANPKLVPIKAEDKIKDLAKIFDSFAETIKPVDQLAIPSPEKPEEVKVAPTSIKNDLMKAIIKNKDRVMFEESKKLLTKAEQQYIEERIK